MSKSSEERLRRRGLHPLVLVLIAVLVLSVWSRASYGQASLHLGISGGATIPAGRFADLNDTGYNFGAHVILSSPFFPQDFKLDATHNRLKLKGGGGNTMVTSATLNLEWQVASAVASVSPYLSGGLGAYYVKTGLVATPTTTRYDNTTKFGWAVGGGLRMAFGPINSFLEARLNRVSSKQFVSGKLSYFPITLGLTL
jgi:opacity protein-like surface antigen